MSEIRATTISDAAGTGPIDLYKQSAAKAWVYASSSASIYSSLNVSSSTDHGTGDYTYGLTAAMVNNQYSQQASVTTNTRDRIAQRGATRDAAGVMAVITSNARSNTAADHANAALIVGDLA